MKKLIFGITTLAALAFLIGTAHRTDRKLSHAQAIASKDHRETTLGASCKPRVPLLKLTELRKDERMDPGSPTYNPVLVAGSGVPMSQIWEAEPRNEKWATAVEHGLQPGAEKILRRLTPDLRDLNLECRTATCRWSWNWEGNRASTREEMLKVYGMMQQMFPGSLMPHPQGNELIEMFTGYRIPGWTSIGPGDSDQLLARISEQQSRIMTAAKEGKIKYGLKYMPASEWLAMADAFERDVK